MESDGKQRTRQGTEKVYQIEVRGELSRRYAAAFEGMEMKTKGGRTILTGEGVDQVQLHGIIDRIGDLGLEILSVKILPDDTRESGPRTPPNHPDEEVERQDR
jgi:hypothetical protein